MDGPPPSAYWGPAQCSRPCCTPWRLNTPPSILSSWPCSLLRSFLHLILQLTALQLTASAVLRASAWATFLLPNPTNLDPYSRPQLRHYAQKRLTTTVEEDSSNREYFEEVRGGG